MRLVTPITILRYSLCTIASMATETFGARVRRLREELGLSIAAVAAASEVSEAVIRRIESGNLKDPSLIVGLLLARVLSTDPYRLALGEAGAALKRIESLEARVGLLERRERRAATPNCSG
jgi:transcriptional regulator with XRE-family HTH domain